MKRTRNLAHIVSEKIDAVRGNGSRLVATALAGGCLVVALVKLIFILTK